LLDLGILCNRQAHIISRKDLLVKYAIGYCSGTTLSCRPKSEHYAVMFQKDDIQFWTHLTVEEFTNIGRSNA
jgi:hypothetical protein